MYSPNLNTLMNILQEDSVNNNDTVPNEELPFALFPSNSSVNSAKEITPKIKRRKILLISDHCHQYTCNSKVSWNLLKLLSKQKKLEAFHYGVNQNEKVNSNFRPYPDNVTYISVKETSKELSGLDELYKYITKIIPDIIVIYFDSDVVIQYLKYLNSNKIKNVKIVAYINMLYYNITDNTIEHLNEYTDHIFVTSNFWKDILIDNNIKKPISILHYGVDNAQAQILDKIITRKKINLPATGFTILCSAKNIQQARYDIIIQAYVKLLSKYPKHEIRLFCMCDKEEKQGHAIIEIYKLEIKKAKMSFNNHLGKILIVPENQVFLDDVKNSIFNSADVSVCCPENDGLNLDSLDMMSVGLPQIVPKCGQFEEYCNSNNSSLIPVHQVYYLPIALRQILSEVRTVNANDIFLALENYLLHPDVLATHSNAAKETMLKYNWDYTSKEFIDYLINC